MRTYQAQDVARYMLALADPESNDISNLKLQKLCYYAQGLLSAMRGSPLFHEKIEAWDHGPVVPELYQYYKSYGSSPIPPVPDFDESIFDESDRRALSDLYNYYGQFSAWRLREMTHDEQPWRDAYRRNDREIEISDLVAYFRSLIDEEYVARVYGREMAHKTA